MSLALLALALACLSCCCCLFHCVSLLFFFNDTATTEIYTLSLHDALPIFSRLGARPDALRVALARRMLVSWLRDRKSTRLNSSHVAISYAVFCLKKKKKKKKRRCSACPCVTWRRM